MSFKTYSFEDVTASCSHPSVGTASSTGRSASRVARMLITRHASIPYLEHTERKTGTDEAKKPDADAVLTCLYVK